MRYSMHAGVNEWKYFDSFYSINTIEVEWCVHLKMTHTQTCTDRQTLSLNISILWVVTLQRWQTQYVLFLRVYFFLLFFFIFFFLWSALRLRSSKFFAHSAWMKQMQHFSGEVCANTFNVSLFCLQEEDKY